jgi:hypothetical protein
MHIGFSSQVTGFYAQKKVGRTLSRKQSCSAPGSARLDSRPDHPAGDRTSPVGDQTPILARVSARGRNLSAGRRAPGLQPGPAGLTVGPSGPQSGGAELIAEQRPKLLPTAKYPFS